MREQLTVQRVPRIGTAWRSLSRTDRYLLKLWLGLRVLTSVWAALISSLAPLTPQEQAIALWPPTQPLGAWLGRALLWPWLRWDAEYYLKIVQFGYRADDGTAQFHPLLAWLATPLTWLIGQPLLSLLLVSSLAGALLLLVFERLARLDLGQDSRIAVQLLLFSPLAFGLFAPYTEGLWLLWAALCLLCARQGQWWLAGAAGGLATLTRQQGVFLLLPLAWELWESCGRDWRRALSRTHWRRWLALGLIPGGLLVWMIYRAVALGDLRANFSDPQALIYSLVISPSASKVVPEQAFLWPWVVLSRALAISWREAVLNNLVDLTLGAGFLALLALAWRGMRTSYRIYVVTIVLVSFGYYTGPFYPYMGLPRHLLLAFPVFIGCAPLFRPLGRRLLLVCLGLMGLLFLLALYVLHSWVP
jgi:hypothetical protein